MDRRCYEINRKPVWVFLTLKDKPVGITISEKKYRKYRKQMKENNLPVRETVWMMTKKQFIGLTDWHLEYGPFQTEAGMNVEIEGLSILSPIHLHYILNETCEQFYLDVYNLDISFKKVLDNVEFSDDDSDLVMEFDDILTRLNNLLEDPFSVPTEFLSHHAMLCRSLEDINTMTDDGHLYDDENLYIGWL